MLTCAQLTPEILDVWPSRTGAAGFPVDDTSSFRAAMLAHPHVLLVDALTGTPVVAAGIIRSLPGASGCVGEVWMLGTPLLTRHQFEVVRLLRRFLDLSILSLGVRRVHCFVRADLERARKFAMTLGFGFEARLHNLGPDGQHYDVFIFKGGVK